MATLVPTATIEASKQINKVDKDNTLEANSATVKSSPIYQHSSKRTLFAYKQQQQTSSICEDYSSRSTTVTLGNHPT
jgi:hypothetical protein